MLPLFVRVLCCAVLFCAGVEKERWSDRAGLFGLNTAGQEEVVRFLVNNKKLKLNTTDAMVSLHSRFPFTFFLTLFNGNRDGRLCIARALPETPRSFSSCSPRKGEHVAVVVVVVVVVVFVVVIVVVQRGAERLSLSDVQNQRAEGDKRRMHCASLPDSSLSRAVYSQLQRPP